MKPKINIRRGLLSLALTAALIVSAIGVKEFMGQYAPTATPGVRVYASDDSTEPQEPSEDEQKMALSDIVTKALAAKSKAEEIADGDNIDNIKILTDEAAQKKTELDNVSTAFKDVKGNLSSVGDEISVKVGETEYQKSDAQTLVSETETAVWNAYQAIQFLLDTKNLGEALDSARAAQSSAASARSTLAEEKAKGGIGDNPRAADSTIQNAKDYLFAANTAFEQVKNDVSFRRTENGRDIEYNRAKVKQEIDAAVEAIQQAELDKMEIYCVEAVYHLNNAGAKILAVDEIIKNKGNYSVPPKSHNYHIAFLEFYA